MVLKSEIRNEHREAYRDGNLEEIPPHVLELLDSQYPTEKGQNAKIQKAKKTKEVDDGA